MKKRIPLLVLFLAMACLSSKIVVSAPSKENDAEPNWELLDFSGKRTIKRISIIIYKQDDFLAKPKADFEVSTTDEDILKTAEFGFGSALRKNPPKWQNGGAFGNVPFGELTVEATSKSFKVVLDDTGFSLGDAHPTAFTTFYSWSLAKAVEDTLLSKRHELGRDRFEHLSGEFAMKTQRRIYDEAKTPKK